MRIQISDSSELHQQRLQVPVNGRSVSQSGNIPFLLSEFAAYSKSQRRSAEVSFHSDQQTVSPVLAPPPPLPPSPLTPPPPPLSMKFKLRDVRHTVLNKYKVIKPSLTVNILLTVSFQSIGGTISLFRVFIEAHKCVSPEMGC